MAFGDFARAKPRDSERRSRAFPPLYLILLLHLEIDLGGLRVDRYGAIRYGRKVQMLYAPS